MPEVEMILNQGWIGSCVAHTLVVAAKILNWQLTNKIIDFSPMALYGTRHSGHYTGIGMIPTEAVSVATKDGFFYRRDFDEQVEVPQILQKTTKFKSENPDKVEEAKKFQFSGYARVRSTGNARINEVKRALKNRMPVAGMWTLYESFYKTGKDGKVPVPNTYAEDCLGNHEMLVVGWTKDEEWVVINSWGLSQGLRGIYLIPFAYKAEELITLSDTISPCKPKAKHIQAIIGEKYLIVDDKKVDIDVAPFISSEDRTLIPIRFISEYLGASVEWIQDEQQVIIRSEEHNIEMFVGTNVYYIDKFQYFMDTVPIIQNDRTFVPLRYVSEALKCKVMYKEEQGKQIVDIYSL
jgi:hypothetical protein